MMEGSIAFKMYDPVRDRPDRTAQFSMRQAGMPTSAIRRFEVSGEDEEGNVHSFHTDNRDQARDIADLLLGDLKNVRILENG